MGSGIILLKHAYPTLIENVPPREWKLGDEGRQQSAKVVSHFRNQGIKHILSSLEPKALETATIIGNGFGLKSLPVDGLHEFDIPARPIMTKEQHVEANRRIFDFPDEPTLGSESAKNARNRFATALTAGLRNIPSDDTVLVVSHGTVISLFVGNGDFEKSFSIWRRLACMSYVRLDRQNFTLIEIVENPLA